MILPQSFFDRPTLIVARELIGKFLVRKWRGKIISAMITEVEAYDGQNDKASHAFRGRTSRNAPMFGPAGCWYVYLVYGMYHMLNIVTGPVGYPAAILIRGVVIATSTNIRKSDFRILVDGPGKITRALHVGRQFNGCLASRQMRTSDVPGLWIEDRGVIVSLSKIKMSPRIGVEYAGRVWAMKKYRFGISI